MEYNYLPAELPIRAWKEFEASNGENQVSQLLCVAWAVFVVPVERLDFLESKYPHHTSDVNSETGTPRELVDLWTEKKAELVTDLEKPEGVYSYGDQESLMPPGTNDWRSQILDEKNLKTQPTYADLVSVLRHGLSHGNIWTDNEKKHIENIYIANYPSSKKWPVEVLHITDSTLYTLVGDFVKWYTKCITSNSRKEYLSNAQL